MSATPTIRPRRYFVARSGTVTGPLSEKNFSALSMSGELGGYTWFWDSADPRWQAIDPAPAAPAGEEAADATPRAREPHEFDAVCHDRANLVSGVLSTSNEQGGELTSRDARSYPAISSGSPLFLNLIDRRTGRVSDRQARLVGVARRDGAWVYRVSWTR